jgi:hypothetical protein
MMNTLLNFYASK